jgi:hypothetical protein
MVTESFSFAVRPVTTHADLLRACEVRAIAYGNKIPEYRESMLSPDSVDQLPATGVYLCEDKITGQAIGTMRVQVSRPGLDGLEIEKYAPTPSGFAGLARAEITRLAALPGSDPFVRLALWKVGYMHCANNHVRLLMIAVRKPSLIRAYERMGAKDISAPIAIPYAGNLAHRIMAINIQEAEVFWRESNHPMLQFMAETTHPDILAFQSGSVPCEHQRSRQDHDQALDRALA